MTESINSHNQANSRGESSAVQDDVKVTTSREDIEEFAIVKEHVALNILKGIGSFLAQMTWHIIWPWLAVLAIVTLALLLR